jgi:hypothetical protein
MIYPSLTVAVGGGITEGFRGEREIEKDGEIRRR